MGTLPGTASLRLCTSPACANGTLANGGLGKISSQPPLPALPPGAQQHHHHQSNGPSPATEHHYSDLNFQSLRRGNNGRNSRTSPRNASRPSSPSPPPPPPPRYPAQYPTLPMNGGSTCQHYQRERETVAGGGTLSGRERARERGRESSSRRMEQLSASSHQQRQEELEAHRAAGSLARRELGGYHA